MRRKLMRCCAAVLLSLIVGHFAAAEAAAIEQPHDTLRVVELSGTPYEIGYQHGRALQDEVRRSVSTVLGYFRAYLKIPLLRSWAACWWLDRAWSKAWPYIPTDIRDELRGLSEGSGVSLRELYRLHAVPDRTYSCSNLAAWGPATDAGRLVHIRNLDWNIDVGIQEFATVFVIRPTGKHAFVNVAWAGFAGVLTGINDQQLSIGQIGAETVEVTFKGQPMVFLMRRVLEESAELDTAVRIITEAPRTVGVNYVVADAKAPRAVVVETNRRAVRTFEANDPAEHQVSYARPMAHAVFRADAAMDPQIRDRQLASRGDPKRPGLEDPAGSSAYDVRYLGQADGLQASYGALDVERAMQIARAIAPDSNIQSVIMAWPELWVANAQGQTPAAETSYHHLNIAELLAGGLDEASN